MSAAPTRARADGDEAPGQRQGDMPGVRQRPVGPAPERLDPAAPAAFAELPASQRAARRSASLPAPAAGEPAQLRHCLGARMAEIMAAARPRPIR